MLWYKSFVKEVLKYLLPFSFWSFHLIYGVFPCTNSAFQSAPLFRHSQLAFKEILTFGIIAHLLLDFILGIIFFIITAHVNLNFLFKSSQIHELDIL